MPPVVEFWLDFASTYSYLSGLRIEGIAAQHGVKVRWRPFLLGPIFADQGWSTSPFNLYRVKGRYMVRDIERRAAGLGAHFHLPDPFPQNSLLAARVALAITIPEHRAAFGRHVLEAEFSHRRSIADSAVIADCLKRANLDAAAIMLAAQTEPIKTQLRIDTQQAQALGIFGAPSFITADGELFWGDDRLEDSLMWATQLPQRQA